MISQLPKIIKDRHNLKIFLKKASTVIHHSVNPREIGLEDDSLEFTDIEQDPIFKPEHN